MYVIVLNEERGDYFWTCDFNGTQNYTNDIADATVFRSKSAAQAMVFTLGKEDHRIVEVDG